MLDEHNIPEKGNVLVIEDDPDTGEMIEKALTDNGYGVRVVRSRDDAVRMLKRYLYNFILLDYWMPGMTAENFIAQVSEGGSRAKVILMTAGGTIRMIASHLEIDDWLGKPFFPEELIEKLDELAGRVPVLH